jgi:hypothetical protein
MKKKGDELGCTLTMKTMCEVIFMRRKKCWLLKFHWYITLLPNSNNYSILLVVEVSIGMGAYYRIIFITVYCLLLKFQLLWEPMTA